jgi:hypothetical protein
MLPFKGMNQIKIEGINHFKLTVATTQICVVRNKAKRSERKKYILNIVSLSQVIIKWDLLETLQHGEHMKNKP